MDPELIAACGESPGFICEWVFEQTNNDFLAEAAVWVFPSR